MRPRRTGAFCSRRLVSEVRVDLVETVEELRKANGSDGTHDRQADRRVDGVAPADPIPEPEHVRGVDAELRHAITMGGDCDEMLGYGRDVFRCPDRRTANALPLSRW